MVSFPNNRTSLVSLKILIFYLSPKLSLESCHCQKICKILTSGVHFPDLTSVKALLHYEFSLPCVGFFFPTQTKWKGNAISSIYITLRFFNILWLIWGILKILKIFFQNVWPAKGKGFSGVCESNNLGPIFKEIWVNLCKNCKFHLKITFCVESSGHT